MNVIQYKFLNPIFPNIEKKEESERIIQNKEGYSINNMCNCISHNMRSYISQNIFIVFCTDHVT